LLEPEPGVEAVVDVFSSVAVTAGAEPPKIATEGTVVAF
jgi:hypothetical protein